MGLKMFNKKNKNIITFIAKDEHAAQLHEKPFPSVNKLPQWWKDMPAYPEGQFELSPAPSVTVKRCMSVFDAMSAGYIVPLWADVMVTQGENGPTISWLTTSDVFSAWPSNQVDNFELSDGYSKVVFKYLNGWIIKTPPGWSSLITTPFSYQNLPMKAIAGIVDTDVLTTDINTPMIIKEGFEGIIPKGTPLFQVIPIKRENWISEFKEQTGEKHFFNQEKLKTILDGAYRKYMRIPKSYK